MKLSHEIITLRTTHPFIIARGGSSEYRVVRVTVTDDDGATGWGEAAPSRHYGETADTVVAALPAYAAVLEGADGWSLEALVGFPPFDGADAFSVGYKHVHEKPVPIAEIDSRVPEPLAAIVMRCLEKAAGDRYERGNALADALIGFLSRSDDVTPSHRQAIMARIRTPSFRG